MVSPLCGARECLGLRLDLVLCHEKKGRVEAGPPDKLISIKFLRLGNWNKMHDVKKYETSHLKKFCSPSKSCRLYF